MKFGSQLLTELGGLGIATYLRWQHRSLDLQVAHYDVTADPGRPESQGRVIVVFWHEYIALPLVTLGHCNFSMLNSRHRDADWLARSGYHLGFDVVRGSTNRGGASALRELKQKSRDWNLVITPDGPMGPRREMEMGPVYLASRLGIPLVPLGVGFDRPWRLDTWDKFAVPRPYSRARKIWGPRLHLPRDLDRAGLVHYTQEVSRLLNCLTTEAETWAESGTRRTGQRPYLRQPPWKARRYDRPAHHGGPHRATVRHSLVPQECTPLAPREAGSPSIG